MKRNNLVRTVVILVVLGLSLWKLYPTFRLQTLSADEVQELKLEGRYDELQANAIKRGLDLQGGIYLVLEVDLAQLAIELSEKKDDQFYQIIEDCRAQLKQDPEQDFFQILYSQFMSRNIKLNRYYGTRLDDDQTILSNLNAEANDAIDRSLQILRNRVDQFGVAEPNIQKQGSRRIVLELPGIQEIERAKDLIGKTALLEFKMLIDSDIASDVLRRIDETVKRDRAITSDTTAQDTTQVAEAAAPDTSETGIVRAEDLFGTTASVTDTDSAAQDTSALSVDEQFFSENPFLALLRDFRGQGGEVAVPEANRYAVDRILNDPEVQKIIPGDAEFLWSSSPTQYGNESYWQLYLVRKEPGVTGKYLTDANVQIGGGSDFQSQGQPVVQFEFNSEGARILSRLTGANINKRMAIVLDDNVYSAPVIQGKIPRGSGIIEGIGDMKEAQQIAIVLRAGALPAPVQIIEERTVGPSLGADSIERGTKSTVIGFLVVIVFMLIYYKMSGGIANVALFMNLVIIFAILAGFHFTLTLPGVAGIILTIGMAVDANVLIFERIREEVRAGKTVRAAIDTGYERAFSAIMDANVTTLISAVVLYQFGTGPIRGFALTLSIGILSSLFTALVVTRVIFDYLTARFTFKKLSI